MAHSAEQSHLVYRLLPERGWRAVLRRHTQAPRATTVRAQSTSRPGVPFEVQEVFQTISKVAATDAGVLILGDEQLLK